MKFATKNDIEAPVDFVFAQITDYASLEGAARRQGVIVNRVDTRPVPGVGSVWNAMLPFRGKERKVRLEITKLEVPGNMAIKSKSGGLDSETKIDLVALSGTHTRLTVEIELIPTNLTSRLLVQSFKLATNSISTMLQNRLTSFAKEVEDRYKRGKSA
jgi:hypothetical protein